ncbi:hypothetical protein AX17_003881 [Amanita inopinata Kibby_2008]|nr:hypothetical protein AX17_003881 [Amanita inopinata Kibby_2008]
MTTPRLPRLTLFSGPNCSLCDIAKAELAKVRQRRPFQLDVINIQDKGQETWKAKYIHWIPALHLEGKEIAKGRWSSDVGVDTDPVLFFYDAWPYGWTPVETSYVRDIKTILGESERSEALTSGSDKRTNNCFNCGSPDHMVFGCPWPKDRAVISLSRQYHNLLHDNDAPGYERMHAIIEWRNQRLQWLDEFEPGIIKSPLLKDALGDEHLYLRKIALWGYPSGWFNTRDPREIAKERIKNGNTDSTCEDGSFFIFGDNIEEVCGSNDNPSYPDDANVAKVTKLSLESPTVSSRWASYPNTYFDSDTLPIYSPLTKPIRSDVLAPNASDTFSTFTPERERLWQRIISGSALKQGDPMTTRASSMPPWRDQAGILMNWDGQDALQRAGGDADMTPPPQPAHSPPPLPSPPPESIKESSVPPLVMPRSLDEVSNVAESIHPPTWSKPQSEYLTAAESSISDPLTSTVRFPDRAKATCDCPLNLPSPCSDPERVATCGTVRHSPQPLLASVSPHGLLFSSPLGGTRGRFSSQSSSVLSEVKLYPDGSTQSVSDMELSDTE